MDALIELHDEAVGLLRGEQPRLLHVVVPAARRSAVLALLRGLEHHPLAPGPVVVLEAPHGADPGWSARSERLRRHHEQRALASEASEDTPSWPPLGPPPSSRGLAGFAEQLAAVLAATPACRGWVVVLAPAYVKAAPQWSRAIAMLLQGSALGAVRWVVVDVDGSSRLEGVAEGAEIRRVQLDAGASPPSERTAELAAALAGPATSGAPGARARGATPPLRPGQAPPPADDPEVARRRTLAGLVLAASLAQRTGDPTRAVEQQRKARDLCTDADGAGWAEHAVSMELLLGAHLLAAGAGEPAERSARRAVEAAAAVPSRPELQPLAQLSLGSTLMARGDRPAAMLTYAEAVASAERAGSIALQLEACRLTADAAILLGMETQAIAFWSRAVTLAESEPLMGALGSATHSARAMALLCRTRGLQEASQRYWEAAARFDGVDLDLVEVQRAGEVAGVEVAPAPPPDVTPEPAPAPLFVRSGSTIPLSQPVSSPSPSPAAIDEGTADLSIEDLAALHWQGMLPSLDQPGLPPPTVIHAWTPAEQDAIRRATTSVIAKDSTSLLTREEIFALHGEADLPPAREASPSATAMLERAAALATLRATDPEAEGTAWVDQDALVAIRARLGRSLLHHDEDEPPKTERTPKGS